MGPFNPSNVSYCDNPNYSVNLLTTHYELFAVEDHQLYCACFSSLTLPRLTYTYYSIQNNIRSFVLLVGPRPVYSCLDCRRQLTINYYIFIVASFMRTNCCCDVLELKHRAVLGRSRG